MIRKRGSAEASLSSVPYDAIDSHVCVRAVDQQHVRPRRGVLGDSGVEGGGGENGDIVVDVVHQDRHRPGPTQRRRAWGRKKERGKNQHEWQWQFITLSTHMTDVNMEDFLTDRIRNSSLCHRKLAKRTQFTFWRMGTYKYTTALIHTPAKRLSHNIPAAFNSSEMSLATGLSFHRSHCHINTHQRRTHQKGSMSLKPNLSGVLPGVWGTLMDLISTERYLF